MPLNASVAIPTLKAPLEVEFTPSSSIVFIGANGAGKTRLGVWVERTLSSSGNQTHRIAAQRSLVLNPNLVVSHLEAATNKLLYGYDQGTDAHKEGHRWKGNPAVAPLSDFDDLLRALYAENNDVAVAYLQEKIAKPKKRIITPKTKIAWLKEIWETVLPHRKLLIIASNVKTCPPDDPFAEYAASEMSDGERVIFYIIGQSLLAPHDGVLIFDEPELHINKAILNQVWDEIESARPDCSFVYITHDVEFSASRHAASKFALRMYRKEPEAWDIESIPEGSGLPDDIVAKIVGSRNPVLFVEGEGGSLDAAIYRRVYTGFTVIPVGSCDQVIHTVASFAERSDLHRFGCAGIIDADGRSDQDAARLAKKGVYRLPVAEVENLLLLPEVFLALAHSLKFDATEAQSRLEILRNIVLAHANRQVEEISLRYTRRQIDAEMKRIGLSSKDIAALDLEFKSAASAIDPEKVFKAAKDELLKAVAAQDYKKVLLLYDNKGLLSDAAKLLGHQTRALEQFIGRALRSEKESVLRDALVTFLPKVQVRP